MIELDAVRLETLDVERLRLDRLWVHFDTFVCTGLNEVAVLTSAPEQKLLQATVETTSVYLELKCLQGLECLSFKDVNLLFIR